MSAHTLPRRVDFHQQDMDFQVALLGSLGFSTQCICDRTGLSPCQVTYRLGIAQIKRATYRNGGGEFAEVMIASAGDVMGTQLREALPAVRAVTRGPVAPPARAARSTRRKAISKHPRRQAA